MKNIFVSANEHGDFVVIGCDRDRDAILSHGDVAGIRHHEVGRCGHDCLLDSAAQRPG